MTKICKDEKKAARAAERAAARRAAGKCFFLCTKCGRASDNAEHLCQPEKVFAGCEE